MVPKCPDISALVPKCLTGTSAPVPKCPDTSAPSQWCRNVLCPGSWVRSVLTPKCLDTGEKLLWHTIHENAYHHMSLIISVWLYCNWRPNKRKMILLNIVIFMFTFSNVEYLLTQKIKWIYCWQLESERSTRRLLSNTCIHSVSIDIITASVTKKKRFSIFNKVGIFPAPIR